MRSTSGEHYAGLDHVRGLAAMLVFSWHFVHGSKGYPVPFEGAPFWGPLSLFDEGHVGVALFMTLSGYLFAKLLDGRSIVYRWFLWNRVVRLFPLLLAVILLKTLVVGLESGSVERAATYLLSMAGGFIYPTWPNGGWSIAVELHFYLLLPILLLLARRSPGWLVVVLSLAVLGRGCRYQLSGEGVQWLAYWTICGRIDQFLLGMLAFHLRSTIAGRHGLVALVGVAFMTLYWWFDRSGGFYGMPTYPSPSPLWIVLPTLEGLAFAVFVSWYDNSFVQRGGRVSDLLARIGEYSYSIYLLHFFVVFRLADFVHRRVLDLSNYYVAWAISIVAFLAMMPIGYLSMRYIERPFLLLRRRYTVDRGAGRLSPAAASASGGPLPPAPPVA